MLGLIGGVIFVIALIALVKGPAETKAGLNYDQQLQDYNRQMKELAEANPSLPAFSEGKTRQQAHREDSIFGLVLSSLMLLVGMYLYRRNRPRETSESSC